MKKLLIATTAIGIGVAVIASLNESVKQVQDRFPNLNKKKVRKAYLNFLRHTFQGKYENLGDLTDEQMDLLFMNEYFRVILFG